MISGHFKFSELTLSSLPLLTAPLLVTGMLQLPALAETQLQCIAPSAAGITLLNQASYTYADGDLAFIGTTETVSGQVLTGGALSITPQGIKDGSGNLVYNLGTIAAALKAELLNLGWVEDEATRGSVAAVTALSQVSGEATYQQVMDTARAAVAQAVPAKATVVNSNSIDRTLALSLVGLSLSSQKSIGLTQVEAEKTSQAATAVITTTAGNVTFKQLVQTAFQDAAIAVPEQAALLNAANQALTTDLGKLHSGKETGFQAEDILRFHFKLTNTGTAPVKIDLPTLESLQQNGLQGAGTITAVQIEELNTPEQSLSITPGQQVILSMDVKLGAIPAGAAPLSLALGNGCNREVIQQTIILLPPTTFSLTDPFGRITGCNGEELSDYRGIRVALYKAAPNDNTGEISELLPLVRTELPDNLNNQIPPGLDPNSENSNPYALVNGKDGKYNFLMTKEQLRPGQTYVLIVSPPNDSSYSERRIRINIGERTDEGISYRATALDGRSISATDNSTSVAGTLRISDAAKVGVALSLLDLDTSICQTEAIQIVKTGDRATAAPGDTVIYRLLVRNISTTAIDNLIITDDLPLGFNFLEESVRAEIGGRDANITTSQDGSTIAFQINRSIPKGGTLSIAYGAQLTPDALRGDGENSAVAKGRRDDNDWVVRDGPAVHRLRIEPGIITDHGTIIGRVFVDKNFDGEQQPGEAGVPNAVIILDDGNRITTDPNGLFSVANVLPGYRTGALDLTSLPGYTLAPNQRFIERNSPSRLVHLEPGGMVRMNFGVTPAADEEVNQ